MAEGLAFIGVVFLPIVLISRWRGWGVLASTLGVWITIYLLNPPASNGEPDEAEFLEDWLHIGGLITFVWCVAIYCFVSLWDYAERRNQIRRAAPPLPPYDY